MGDSERLRLIDDAKGWMTQYQIARDELVTAEASEKAARHSYEALMLERRRLVAQNDKLTTALVLALELAKGRA